jgi:O-antigen chain-terminating methyltransferase
VDLLSAHFVQVSAIAERSFVRTLEDSKAQVQALINRLARTCAEDIAMQAQALRDLSRQVSELEQRQADWNKQSERLAALEHRQIEMRQELDRFGLASHPERIREQEHRLQSLEQRLAAGDRRCESLDERCSELAASIAAARAAQSEAQAQARSHYEEFKLTRERIQRAERRLRRLLNGEHVNGAAPSYENPPAPSGAEAEMDYVGFEDRLRDSRSVKDKQRGYLKYFLGKAPVIDVGCGKGEFLELMREAGIGARGLDLDLDMVLQCREKGLDVERCDAIDYLAGQPDGSVGGIFSAQVIEHLTSAQLSALITLSWRKLAPGAIMVLETLNPESLFVHYKWFWMDPSHVRLVHPLTLQFLLESAGFAEVSCRLTSPPADVIAIPPLPGGANGALEDFNRATDYLNKLIYGDQEYFVVGRK